MGIEIRNLAQLLASKATEDLFKLYPTKLKEAAVDYYMDHLVHTTEYKIEGDYISTELPFNLMIDTNCGTVFLINVTTVWKLNENNGYYTHVFLEQNNSDKDGNTIKLMNAVKNHLKTII